MIHTKTDERKQYNGYSYVVYRRDRKKFIRLKNKQEKYSFVQVSLLNKTINNKTNHKKGGGNSDLTILINELNDDSIVGQQFKSLSSLSFCL